MNRENRIAKLKYEIKDYFKQAIKIKFIEEPELKEEYLYFSFEDSILEKVQFKMYYPISLNHFLDMEKGDRILFILTALLRQEFGEDR